MVHAVAVGSNDQTTLSQIRYNSICPTPPVGIAGTHIQSYGFITALAQKYGSGEFVMLHIEAHYDSYSSDAGRFVHNGSLFKTAVDLGIVNGSDIIQIGLRGTTPNAADQQWMMDNGLKIHYQAEILRDGWDIRSRPGACRTQG